ncbi:DUF998 domain-containing protein [Labedaea rhizosphaerae]|uniref:Uncharacterized protein DUF998 n=1 Tax=Labedaea rhizosphaerae TaxID=598644 RepID=A0A4R6SC00_LABRH|nr:DUF998 domain-containing protein [Labedaea rhizosphaerae]TDP97480.1 uncharacterized protein DUF998 [Labedaea rhizosphaerae]
MTLTAPAVRPTAALVEPARSRLIAGAVAGPLFMAVSYAQAFTRAGFDLSVHPFSFLSLGSLGWLQITNFAVSGLLFVIGATGVRRALPTSRFAPLGLGAMGVGMIMAACFSADPAYGFPAGVPEHVSLHGNLHAVAFVVAILGWITAAGVLSRRFFAQGRRGLGWYSAISAVLLVAPLPFMGASGGVVVLYASATLGWTWSAIACAKLVKR